MSSISKSFDKIRKKIKNGTLKITDLKKSNVKENSKMVFQYACKRGKKDIVTNMINIYKQKTMPLALGICEAAKYNHVEIVKYLLSIDKKIYKSLDNEPILTAMRYKSFESAKLILSKYSSTSPIRKLHEQTLKDFTTNKSKNNSKSKSKSKSNSNSKSNTEPVLTQDLQTTTKIITENDVDTYYRSKIDEEMQARKKKRDKHTAILMSNYEQYIQEMNKRELTILIKVANNKLSSKQ